ncbi:MAG TPA: hypothetical protein VK806_06475 [Bacteroidia bacterium]|jgi:hypothetical protein|nr:hypothetical protein [Bacteroidia bacterium]
MPLPESDSLFTSYISISAGMAIPVGVYGYNITTIDNAHPSVNGTSDYAGAGGFAGNGTSITITAIASLKRPGTSFMGQIGYFQNRFNTANYASYNISSQNNYYATTNQLTVSNSYYQIISALFGMYMPITGLKLTLGIRLMGGAVLCISPDISYSGQATLVKVNSTSNVSDHIASATAISWAVTPSIDLRYLASKKISVVAAFGFFFCLPKFNANETDASGNTSSIRLVCPTSIVTATAGIGYRL